MPKTIVEINCSTVGSTGRIMFMIAKMQEKQDLKYIHAQQFMEMKRK